MQVWQDTSTQSKHTFIIYGITKRCLLIRASCQHKDCIADIQVSPADDDDAVGVGVWPSVAMRRSG